MWYTRYEIIEASLLSGQWSLLQYESEFYASKLVR